MMQQNVGRRGIARDMHCHSSERAAKRFKPFYSTEQLRGRGCRDAVEPHCVLERLGRRVRACRHDRVAAHAVDLEGEIGGGGMKLLDESIHLSEVEHGVAVDAQDLPVSHMAVAGSATGREAAREDDGLFVVT